MAYSAISDRMRRIDPFGNAVPNPGFDPNRTQAQAQAAIRAGSNPNPLYTQYSGAPGPGVFPGGTGLNTGGLGGDANLERRKKLMEMMMQAATAQASRGKRPGGRAGGPQLGANAFPPGPPPIAGQLQSGAIGALGPGGPVTSGLPPQNLVDLFGSRQSPGGTSTPIPYQSDQVRSLFRR